VIAVDAGGLASLPVLSNEATSRDESVANDLVPPPDVTGLSASADADSAYLTWTKSTDDDGDLVDQWVDVSVDGGLSWGSNAPDFDDGTAAAVGPGRSWYRWRGLADGVDHRLRVRVVDSNGNVSPGTQSGVVTPSPTGAMTLSGTLPTDVSLADGVWRVTGNVTVASDRTLDLGPGAILKFEAGRYLRVNGTLRAEGVAGNPVVLTSVSDDEAGGDTDGDGDVAPVPGSWVGVEFFDSAPDGLNVMRHVEVRYAGSSSRASVYAERTSPVFEDLLLRDGASYDLRGYENSSRIVRVTVRDHGNDGSYFRYGSPTIIDSAYIDNGDQGIDSDAANVSIHGTTITGHRLHGVYFRSSSGIGPLTGNTITGNGITMRIPFSGYPDVDDGNLLSPNGDDRIEVLGNTRYDDLTIPAGQLIHQVSGTSTIGQGALVEVGAGAILKFAGGGLSVSGGLRAVGTAGNEVVFTSYRDDTEGGDTEAGGPTCLSPLI
jgi:hypothetical protein